MGLSCSAAAMSTLNSLNQQSQAQASPQKPPVLVPVCLAPALSLEAELGLAAPLTPYHIVTDRPAAVIFEMDTLGLKAAVGVSVRLP